MTSRHGRCEGRGVVAHCLTLTVNMHMHMFMCMHMCSVQECCALEPCTLLRVWAGKL